MMAKQAYYVMAKLLYPQTGVADWHLLFEATSKRDAEDFKYVHVPMPYEIDCVITRGPASRDCREYRPC
jgi:hypothetical protein